MSDSGFGMAIDKSEGEVTYFDHEAIKLGLFGQPVEMNTWRKEFKEALEQTGDSFDDLVSTMSDEDWDREFDAGYGSVQGCDFTAWSKDWVYFPICYDGSEWVGFAPRNPCDRAMGHQGG